MNKPKVLITDDELKLCNLLKEYLEAECENYIIQTAYSGIEAISILKKEDIDVLLADIRMPGMDGIELMEKAKAIQKDLQTIVITGHGNLDNAVKALRLGAENYLTKPVSGELLNFAVKNALKKKKEIEERRRIRKELKLAKEAAESASRAKSTFLANMSHELRTPLNGILGYSQILKLDKKLEEHYKEKIEIIHQCGEHLLILINDILDLSKIEAGKIELNPSPLYLPEFLDSIVQIPKIKAEQKGIKFKYEIGNDMPLAVKADETRLRQILLNLLSNAVKFTQTGEVALRVRTLNESTPRSAARIAFMVEDSGTGISHDKIKEIFLPFYQLGSSRAQTEGTGLGLSITLQLLNLMGSELHVDSNPGQGSRFYFNLDLPLAKDFTKPEKQRNIKNISAYEGKKLKILIADDNKNDRNLLKNILMPLRFEISEAVDGFDLIDKAFEFNPKLILTDIKMPNMDIYEAVKKLRNKFNSKKLVIIIAVSANTSDHAKKICLESGCDDFIEKPIAVGELLRKIEKYLKLKWIYEKDKNQFPSTQKSEINTITPPPREIIDELIKLANVGNIVKIRKKAKELSAQKQEYSEFWEKIYKFAKGFHIEELQDFLLQYKQ